MGWLFHWLSSVAERESGWSCGWGRWEPAKCRRETVICLLSLHSHPIPSHSNQPSCDPSNLACVRASSLAYCRRVSFAISQHSSSKFPSPHSSYQLLSPFNFPTPNPIRNPQTPSLKPKSSANANANPNPQLLVAIVAHFRRIHLALLMGQTKPNGYAGGRRSLGFGHLNGLKIFSYIWYVSVGNAFSYHFLWALSDGS